jgi:unspecific monooxygenase
MLDMKATIVGVWGRFQTAIVDDEGMVANGGYMAEPLGVGTGGEKGIGGKYAEDGEARRFLRLSVKEV